MNKSKSSVLTLVVAALAGTAAIGANAQGRVADVYIPSQQQQASTQYMVKTGSSRSMANYPDFTGVAEHTINSVVSIKNYASVRQQSNNFFQFGDGWDPFEFFFGPGNGQQQRKQQQQQPKKSDSKPQLRGSGSGVIISADGYIVTNNHVVDGADKLTVTLNDNSEYNARVIGTDPNTDLALIKINAKNLQPITFANSDDVKVGEWCVAVGNPFGFNSSVTVGVISAKGRGLNESANSGIKSFIQHDAAVNPGNSGGALVNTDGELIGINTMIYSQTGNYAGISFAVPSNTVRKVEADLRQYGTVQRAVLGISYQELDADLAKEHKITATNEGIYVAKVTDRGAAKEAGLQEGDVIVKFNGTSIKNGGELQEQMNKLRPGDKATLGFYRDNKYKTAQVTFKNDQGTTKITKSSDFASLGASFLNLTSKEKDDLSISNGVKVTGVREGKFKAAGVRDGFIITTINDEPVNNSDDVETIYDQIMHSNADKVMYIKGITATGKTKYYAVDLSDAD